MSVYPLLEGKTALVTGGSSGIGRGVALGLATHGADVINADIREKPREGGTPTHEKIEQELDAEAHYLPFDSSNVAEVETMVEQAEEIAELDVLVNNAAMILGHRDFDLSEDDFDRIVGVNIKGYYFVAREVARRMMNRERGSIVTIGSIEAYEGEGTRPVYGLTRGAVRQLTWALAAELGPYGIRVNTVHPGLVESAMTTQDVPIFDEDAERDRDATVERFLERIPLGRAGQPSDIAGPVVFLASDLARYVHGADLLVDGGLTTTV